MNFRVGSTVDFPICWVNLMVPAALSPHFHSVRCPLRGRGYF